VQTRPFSRLTVWRSVVSAAAGLLVAGLLASSAGATGSAPRPTVREVQQRLRHLTAQVSAVGQLYDRALANLAAARQRVRTVDRQASRAQEQFQAARGQVAQIAAAAFMEGNQNSAAAMLTSGDAQQIVDRSSILLQLASGRDDRVEEFVAAARRTAQAQQIARRTRTALLALKAKLGAQKKRLDKLVARQEALLAQLSPVQQAPVGPGGPPVSVGGPYSGPTSTRAGKAVAFAYAQIGKPYVWGATGPSSYDCSGLMLASWAAAGVSIPRDTYGEWAGLPHIPLSTVQPGDLIMFSGESHVAMYVGGGYLIDAPHSGAYVQKVAFTGWFADNAIGALRP
jgi:peptidoglycan DL-endopeptidase CwlO